MYQLREISVAQLAALLVDVNDEATLSPNAVGNLRILLRGEQIGYVDLGPEKRVVYHVR